MAKFEVGFSVYGTAIIEADDAEQAERIVVDGCMSWQGDIDWEAAEVTGCDVDEAEEFFYDE